MNRKQKTMNALKQWLPIVLCSLFIVPLLWSLLRPGFYASHDGEWMAIRLTSFHRSLREGQFPVRWVSRLDHEHGYPVFNFLYPLPFYIAEPIYILTKDAAMAVKATMGLSIISMGIGTYMLLKKKGNLIAFVGFLAFVYSPYIAFNLYQRGSLGELVALGFVPWIFYALQQKRFAIASILMAGLILSHNVVAILFFPIVLLYLFTRLSRSDVDGGLIIFTRLSRSDVDGGLIIQRSIFIILSLGLSAFFWLPALGELQYVRASKFPTSDFANEYLTVSEAFKRTGIVGTVFNMGLPLYFLSNSSAWLWSILKPLQVIQFPWRLLSVFSFSGAIILSELLTAIRKKIPLLILPISLISLIFLILFTLPFFRPVSFFTRPPMYYETNDDTTTVRAEYTPIWVVDLPKKRPSVPTVHYYPGLKLFCGAQEQQALDPKDTGGLLVGKNENDCVNRRVVWSETPFRSATNFLSLISVFLVFYWYLHKNSLYSIRP